jgi:TRAP-type mannitol/chloroaromatic compound transport system permease large subunit
MVYPAEVYSPEPEIRVEPEKEPNYEAEATKSMYYTQSGSGEEPVSTEPLLAKEDQIENGEEDPLAKKRRRRFRRRVRMTVCGTAGLIVGAIIFCGPIGVIVGGAAGAVGARVISKRRERLKDERVARENVAADTATPTEMSQAVLS